MQSQHDDEYFPDVYERKQFSLRKKNLFLSSIEPIFRWSSRISFLFDSNHWCWIDHWPSGGKILCYLLIRLKNQRKPNSFDRTLEGKTHSSHSNLSCLCLSNDHRNFPFWWISLKDIMNFIEDCFDLDLIDCMRFLFRSLPDESIDRRYEYRRDRV